MANKNGNPLLSSVISPLDDLPSVLMPSVPVLEKSDYKNLSRNDTSQQSGVSLQPHLSLTSSDQFFSVDSSITSDNTKASESSTSSVIGPHIGIPNIANIGDSFKRKPTSKYVVPPELDVQKKPADPRLTNVPLAPPPGPFMIPSLQASIDNMIPANSKLGSSSFTTKPISFEAIAENPPVLMSAYHPVIPHWFYDETKQDIVTWHPFSFTDSLNLEESFRRGSPTIVATDGGRYDVNVAERKKTPVYWEGKPCQVRRCSWFRKEFTRPLPIPYSEEDADKLEAEFKDALISGRWHRQVELSEGERVMIHSSTSIQHYQLQESLEFPNTVSMSDAQQTPQVVRRGADDFTIPEGAADKVDHLMFLIHGIGPFCDLSFRCVEECVDDFRKLGEDLLASHFKESIDSGNVGRIEFLPISWHKALHGDATGIDNKLKLITLRSIPKFRDFINDTVLDVLFFTSPVYGQHIMDAVASEMERLLTLFKRRNPTFGGKVSVGGHSLGTVILFDLLLHQRSSSSKGEQEAEEKDDSNSDKENDWVKVDSKMEPGSPSLSKVNFEIGAAGTGQPAINYPQLSFKPQSFFLMGSPVGMFITVRGLDTLGPDFRLPTCHRVFNIFHPFDPVAYRIETLIDPSLSELRPVLIPHHKGRKRMHLELKDTIERVGSDIKNRIVESIQATWNTMYQLYSGDFSSVNQAIEDQCMKSAEMSEQVEPTGPQVRVGKLNKGRRIDYVLQEKPYESLTEYIFALQAHLTYWTSEDTMLMILKELYSIEDIPSDAELQSQRRDSVVVTGASGPSVEMPAASSDAVFSSSSILNPPICAAGSVFSSSATPSVPFGAPPPPTTSPFMSGLDIGAAFAAPPSIPPGKTTFVNPPMMPSPLTGLSTAVPRALSGRPVFDPSVKPSVMGVDPTASPASATIGPPPKLPKISFNKK